MELSSRLVEQFVAIVDCGGVTTAAAQLGMSQGALSSALQRLEDQLGMPLVVRGPRFGLTGAGAVLLERARPLVDGLREVERAADRLAAGSIGQLSIACPPGMSVWPLPDLLRRLFAVASTAAVDVVRTQTAEESIEELRSMRADLALVPRIEPPLGLISVPTGFHRLSLVVPKSWKVDRNDASLSALGAFPFIEGRPGTSSAVALQALREAGATPRTIIRNATLGSAPVMVAQGLGAAFLTTPLAALAEAAGCTVVDWISVPDSPVHLLRRPGPSSPLVKVLLGLVLEDHLDPD